MSRLWLVSYDVACPRRRYRLDRTLGRLGDRVLASLWTCRLRADQLPALQRRLQQLIRPPADRLSMLPVCADCERRIVFLGQAPRTAFGSGHFVVL